MGAFENQIDRMKALYTYGQISENQDRANYTLEYHATAADGHEYGIIRERGKFYIKTAPKGKGTLAEAYSYIGGFPNKSRYEYHSYNDALKNFNLKMQSINEAQESRIDVEALDPYMNKTPLVEESEIMKNELARARQIMHNACIIMNESSDYGVACHTEQPGAAKGHSGDKDAPFTKEVNVNDLNTTEKSASDPEKQGAPFGDSEKADEGEDITVSGSVASMKPKGGVAVKVNESFEEFGGDDVPEINDDEPVEDEPEFNGDDFSGEPEGDEPMDDEPIEGEPEGEGDKFLDDIDLGTDDLDEPVEDPELGGDEPMENEPVEGEPEGEEPMDDEPVEGEPVEDEPSLDDDPVEGEPEGEEPMDDEPVEDGDDEFDFDELYEERDRILNRMAQSILSELRNVEEKPAVSEEKLDVFGKHPGFRKKPMTYQAGELEDKPFATDKGDSQPFDKLVDSITEAVMCKLRALDGGDKKKVK